MEILIGGITSLFGGGGAAAAGTAAAAAAPVASGFSLATVLQGTATVLGVLSSISAGNAEADALELQAQDAEREKPLENLQGIERRASIKRAMADALGAGDVAYAASGVDLSFGTARAARTDAYREADLALTTDAGTQQTRVARLSERAAGYRASAKQAKRAGLLNGLVGGAKGLASMAERY
ncbi:hypothetical protein GGQ99_000962 [Aminobacter niigataensis]|uniref:Uncharacterized protein n=1 Tax=Aminobacter niigataensis TaxID=83265 RepID=A0ABR6KXT7_9HYPH|nr:hypothetical protein [Aminobacter niigataensis]MBB4649240.1 hypothetical protein [Aminobacter niigataensis]